MDSGSELKFVMLLEKNGISWIKNTDKSFLYIGVDAKEHKYYPDFYLIDYNIYLDPKNSYLIKKHAFKIENAQIRNNIKVLILNESQLKWNVIKTLLL